MERLNRDGKANVMVLDIGEEFFAYLAPKKPVVSHVFLIDCAIWYIPCNIFIMEG